MKRKVLLFLMIVMAGLFCGLSIKPVKAQINWADWTVESEYKIIDLRIYYDEYRANMDTFGSSLANIGDLNGDGVIDLAVGSEYHGSLTCIDDVCIYSTGAAWVLFMNSDEVISDHQRVSGLEGIPYGFYDRFGSSLANIGDLNGDGVIDLAVGAYGYSYSGDDRGAVYILFMNSDGTVSAHQRISDIEGGFGGTLDDWDSFGASVAGLGDLNADGVLDLAVGAHKDDDGGIDKGAVYILFMNSDGTVSAHQKISGTEGGFEATLDSWDLFGASIANIGDLNADGVLDLAVGAQGDGSSEGAVYILFMNSDGTVSDHQKISETEGGFEATLDDGDLFGASIANIGDLNADGVLDLAVGAQGDDDGGSNKGAVYILFMNSDGTVSAHQRISETEGGFGGTLDDWDSFGASVAGLGDLNGDGVLDLAVGAQGDDDVEYDSGAVWILFMKKPATMEAEWGVVLGPYLGIALIAIAIIPAIILFPYWKICAKYPELCPPPPPQLLPWAYRDAIILIGSFAMLFSSIWINFFPPITVQLFLLAGFIYGVGLIGATLGLIQITQIIIRFMRKTDRSGPHTHNN